MWRWVVPAVIVLAAVLSFGAHALQRACMRPVEIELAALRARGKPVTPAQAAPPPVPAQKNVAPLYLRAHALMRQRDPDPYSQPDWLDARSVETLMAAVHDDRWALDLLARASRLSACRFDADYESGLFATVSQSAPMSALARLLRAAAVGAALRREPAAAAEYLRQGLVLSRHVCADGTHLGFQVATSTDRMALDAAQRVLASTHVPRAGAIALSAEAGALDYKAVLSRALDADRAGALDLYERARRDPLRFVTVDTFALWGVSPPKTTDPAVLVARWTTATYLAGPLLWREQAEYLRLAARAEKLAAQPWRESRGRWYQLESERGTARPWSVMAQLLLPGGLAVRVRDEAIARRGLLQAALALNRYRAQHGAFPATLSEVRIEGLRVPEDVFSGRPFVYRKAGDGFTLYSIGPNLRDDGGKDDPENGDIMWNAAPAPL